MLGSKLRILVVDDSLTFRGILSRVLGQLPDVDVVATAQDGEDALTKIRQYQPDLVTLDMEMPKLDGLATLKAIKELGLRTKVLVLSAFGGEKHTVEALFLGAWDFLQKPSGSRSGFEELRQVLQEKVQQFLHHKSSPSLRPPSKRVAPVVNFRTDLVLIAVSTGGPNALAEVLAQLKPPCRVPVLIVQHMPAEFTRLLAERLAAKCALPVHEVTDGVTLLSGNIYLAKGDYHFEVCGSRSRPIARLHQGPSEHGCRPAADRLFISSAKLFPSSCLAVVLTGMGKDGCEGSRAVVQGGGYCIAQNQETSTVWGMPRFVVEAGLAREVLPLQQIGLRLNDFVSGASHK
jgi:two-component system chemotaxis response regulator CheB